MKERYYDLVNDIFDGKYEDAHIEHGCGRKVYLFKDVVVKVPKNTGKDVRTGTEQMKTEIKISEENKYEFLCPVLATYRGCIIMKRIETNPNILTEYVPEGERFVEYIFNEYHNGLNELCEKYSLLVADLMTMNNWGFDYDDRKFKCVDYGLRDDRMNLF